MPTAIIDGISTRYDIVGAGPPLLMSSPGGFDATIEKWTTQGIYARIRPVEHLSRTYTCIVFDRRESGESGGRVEAIAWRHYVAQGKGLLDHLKIPRAHVLGACMGCPPAVAMAVAHPDVVASLVLFWPVGGAFYRINSHARFAEHLAHVRLHGLEGVVALAQSGGTPFNQVVPGRDKAHATSAARYLEECLPGAEYWDAAVEDQTDVTAPARLLQFLDGRE